MKHPTQTLLAACALVASGLAQAQLQAEVTAVVGGPATGAFGFKVSLPPGSGTLAFSDDLFGALAVAGIETSIIGPAVGTVSDTAISITAPIHSVSFTLVADAPGVSGHVIGTRATTLGGAMMVAPKANFATSGGALSVTNISVDLRTQGIFADVSGANGLVSQKVRVWDYAHIENVLELADIPPSYGFPDQQKIYADLKITGLTITDQAFDLFAQGLGLKAGGIAAMASIADYGVMTATIPEPSTYLMMGLGLVGLGMAARRQRA